MYVILIVNFGFLVISLKPYYVSSYFCWILLVAFHESEKTLYFGKIDIFHQLHNPGNVCSGIPWILTVLGNWEPIQVLLNLAQVSATDANFSSIIKQMITLQGRKVIREPKIDSRWCVSLSLPKCQTWPLWVWTTLWEAPSRCGDHKTDEGTLQGSCHEPFFFFWDPICLEQSSRVCVLILAKNEVLSNRLTYTMPFSDGDF